jgi:DNA polymerase V
MIALIDCNNFYCSCERAFRPDLDGKPVIVLSNNDGCAIARSEEAKLLGVEMGSPYYQIKKLIKQHHINVFSSNYTLYSDMNKRITSILHQFAPKVEVYSVDECFLDFSGLKKHLDIEALGTKIREKVTQWTGIPVSVGIAPSKALAKVANKFAKKKKRTIGIHTLETPEQIESILKETATKDLWGIGGRLEAKLKAYGINTAYDFTQQPDDWVRTEMSVQGLRLKYELLGISCRPLEQQRVKKDNITCSRSFGELQADKKIVVEAAANFAARAAAKLRKQNCCAGGITVFLHTHPFIDGEREHNPSVFVPFLTATSATSEIVRIARKAAAMMFWDGIRYLKAGVILHNIVPEDSVQRSLFDNPEQRNADNKASLIMDNINTSYGRDTIRLGSMGNQKKWDMKQAMLSPKYTTDWKQLRLVH